MELQLLQTDFGYVRTALVVGAVGYLLADSSACEWLSEAPRTPIRR